MPLKKKEEDKRKKYMGVNFSYDEYAKIEKFAKENYRTPSDLTRMAVLEYIRKNQI